MAILVDTRTNSFNTPVIVKKSNKKPVDAAPCQTNRNDVDASQCQLPRAVKNQVIDIV